ncbi:EamA family transporter [Paenibacillus alkalitolerans]|uniref:EamA family transporter n=1 Tax=Paenibacillus alkalitolerans TaxID=2799335 RepID=UPI0018F78D2D|nr:DMT family transporter [Paenibacillus alkalitolerans]
MLYVIIFAVTFIWGINGVIDRQALIKGHPVEINLIVTLTMTVVAFIYFALAKMWGIPMQFSKSSMTFAVSNGILIPTAYLIYLYALSRGSLTTVVSITATYPIITFLFAVLLLNEPVSFNKIVGIIMVVAGLYIFVR